MLRILRSISGKWVPDSLQSWKRWRRWERGVTLVIPSYKLCLWQPLPRRPLATSPMTIGYASDLHLILMLVKYYRGLHHKIASCLYIISNLWWASMFSASSEVTKTHRNRKGPLTFMLKPYRAHTRSSLHYARSSFHYARSLFHYD